MADPKYLGIGRLGGQDSEGWHHVMIKPDYREVFQGTDDVYLIFDSDRVFYVSICDRKISNRKTWVRFLEDGITEERSMHREVYLALDDMPAESSQDDLIGFTAIYAGTNLGVVEDMFFNGAQDVIVIDTPCAVELLVPLVEFYLDQVLEDNRVLFLQNLDDLLAANDLEIVNQQVVVTHAD